MSKLLQDPLLAEASYSCNQHILCAVMTKYFFVAVYIVVLTSFEGGLTLDIYKYVTIVKF